MLLILFDFSFQVVWTKIEHCDILRYKISISYSGTCKAAEKYKSGKKTTDVMLQILNLDKTEVITIDIISNQEFTEVSNC